MNDDGMERQTLVVGTEDGIVLTGSRIDSFEAKITGVVRRPFYAISGAIFILFVLVAGLGILMNNMNETVTRIDTTATNAVGPEAQEQQKIALDHLVDGLLDGMDCKDQLNLQRFADRLAEKGIILFQDISVVEPACKTPKSNN